MSDADFEAIQKLQRERNEAAAAKKKGSRAFDSTNQRSDTKAKLTESFDTQLYDRDDGPDKYAGYLTSIPAADGDAANLDGADEDELTLGATPTKKPRTKKAATPRARRARRRLSPTAPSISFRLVASGSVEA